MTRRRTNSIFLAAITLLALAAITLPTRTNTASATVTTAIPDGSLVREDQSFTVFQMIGGAKIAVPDRAEFDALGFSLGSVVVLPAGALSPVPVIPREGTLLRERDSFAIHTILHGRRHWVANPDVLASLGRRPDEAQVVGHGALAAIPTGADIEDALPPEAQTAGSASAYRVTNFQSFDFVSPDGHARAYGDIWWHEAKTGGLFGHTVRRATLSYGSKAQAVDSIACIRVKVEFEYKRLIGSGTIGPDGGSFSGTSEDVTDDGQAKQHCRHAGDHRPEYIPLSLVGRSRHGLQATMITLCTSLGPNELDRCTTHKFRYWED